MKTNLRKALSWMLSLTLLVTCTVSGFVLPMVAEETNLMTNGDFEQGASVAWGNSAYVMDGVGVNGSKGIKIETTVNEGDEAVWPGADYKAAFNAVLEPNTAYIFSFDYKHEGKGFAKFDINRVGSDWTGNWADVNLSDATDWTTYTIEFATGAAENMNINTGWEWSVRQLHYANAASYGTGAAYFDNFKLVKKQVTVTDIMLDKTSTTVEIGKDVTLVASTVPEGLPLPAITWSSADETVATVDNGKITGVSVGTTTITATADGLTPVTCTVTVKEAELLTNGDFEQGASVAWGNSAYVMDGVGVNGSKGIKIETTVNEGDTAVWPGVDYKAAFNAILEPNSTYVFSFDYKHEGKGFAQLDINRIGTDWDGWGDVTLPDATTWTTYTITFTTGDTENMNINTGWEWSVRQRHYANAGDYGTGVAYFDNFKLEKQPEAEAITITPSSIELLQNDTAKLIVTGTPTNTSFGKLTWASDNENVVAVSQDGIITALAASGTATITATNAKGLTATCTVTVNEYGNVLKNGDFEQGERNWHCDVPGSIKPGIGKDGSYGLELTNPEGSDSRSTFYKLELPVLPNTTYEISFDYLADSYADFRIWSGNLALISPVPSGSDTAEWKHASGIFTTPADMMLNPGWDLSILSRAQGKTPAVIDNVCLRLYKSNVEAESVAINHNNLTMVPGRTQTLALMPTPANGDINGAVWTSSNEDVATVSYGMVTAIGKGTTTITAKTRNNKVATCVVTVSGDEALITNGTFDKTADSSWTMGGGAEIVKGKGHADSNAAMLIKDATISQAVTGLQPNTIYQLSFRYRSTSGNMTVKLQNGETVLLKETTDTLDKWAILTYEFTTPEALTSAESTLVLTTDGTGPIYIDNVWLAQKASLVDFVVLDVLWDGGDEQVLTGTELLFAVTVTNQGEDAVAAGSTVEVDIAVDTKVIQTLQYTCETTVNSGDTFIVMGTVPWKAVEGDLVVSARVNPRLLVSETNTVNNASQVHLRVADTVLDAPALAQKAGFDKLVFSDEFDSIDSIDTLATGAEGYKWYVTRNWSAGTVTRDEYDIKDGILTLKNDGSYGITLSTVDVNTHNGFGWNKGYLEVRLRIPHPEVTGGGPNVWSFPLGKALELPGENTRWVEMDWMEFWGVTDRYDQGYWTVTLHDITRPDGAADTSEWYSNTGNAVNALGDKQWHVLSWVWDTNIIQAYMDGIKMFEITYDESTIPSSMPTVHKGELKDGIFSILNEQVNCLYLSGYATNPMEVDYVRIWQGEGGGISSDDDENGEDDEIIVDMDAESFWYNYCTDDWGDPIIKVTKENYQNILEGEGIWNQLSNERKAEINAYLKNMGQTTYDELLEAAQIIRDNSETDDSVSGEGETNESIPNTGESTRALPIAAAIVVLSAAVLQAKSRRGKDNNL